MTEINHIIKVGGKEIRLSTDEARELYGKLEELFGQNQANYAEPLRQTYVNEITHYEDIEKLGIPSACISDSVSTITISSSD